MIGVIAIVVLLILIVIFFVLTGVTANQNRNLAMNQTFIPFSSKFDPITGTAAPFKNLKGDSLVQCPAGTKINILGAFFDIDDPYKQCTNDIKNVNPNFAFICNPSVTDTVPCTDDSACPFYKKSAGDQNPFQCYITKGSASGFCRLRNIGSSDCPSGLLNTNGYCVNPSICGTNIDAAKGGIGVPNPYCSPGSKVASCAIRDASATVAAKCDGKETCDLTPDDFGDFPCMGLAPQLCITKGLKTKWSQSPQPVFSSGQTRTGYCALPYFPGYVGGVPSGSDGNDAAPTSFNLGYTMHGIYSCIPD
jgi:hypothetical protein